MTYRQLADHVKQRARLAHRQMTEAQDDWYPEVFFLREEHLHHHSIPTPWFESRESKAALVNGVIVPLIHVGKVRAVALQLVMFMLSSEHPVGRQVFEREAAGDLAPTAGLPHFQDIEGTEERLWVHVLDAERHEGWSARIARAESGPPQLSPFELLGGPDVMFGDLIDPIKAALR